ncbi:MAG: phosphopantetheine-binding protein [Eubacteriales bacterium]|nr:phosphopantetheine-binding protein [Eubacteriales bacterium]
MDVEEIRESILDILRELHEDIDFEAEEKMVDDKVLDSFDLVTLVTELGEEFDVEITAKDFVAENFNSVDSLTGMIARLLDE